MRLLALLGAVVMITGRHLREMVRLRWQNRVLKTEAQNLGLQSQLLLQYGTLWALTRAGNQDTAPILDEARGALTPAAYAVLQKFIDRLG